MKNIKPESIVFAPGESTLILRHEDRSTHIDERFFFVNGEDRVLGPGESVRIRFDPRINRNVLVDDVVDSD